VGRRTKAGETSLEALAREVGRLRERLERLERSSRTVTVARGAPDAAQAGGGVVSRGADNTGDAVRLASLEVMASGVAHDFNNILAVISGNADLLRQDVERGSPLLEHVDEIAAAARRGSDLASMMQVYAGRGKLMKFPLQLNDVVRRVVDRMTPALDRITDVTVTLDPDLPLVAVDSDRMAQLVTNLLQNASESGEGTRRVHVSVRTALVGGEDDDVPSVLLEVSDDGTGMDEPTMERIFDPFFTTKRYGKGLGLATVLGIVRTHGARIDVESRIAAGSVFRVLLAPAQVDSGTRPRVETSTVNKGFSGTVLLADDEQTVLRVSRRMLVRLGFDVITASDGWEALQTYRSRADEIDVVILDLTMPNMNGEETYNAIRELDPDVVQVLSSGYDERSALEGLDVSELAGFLPKPYTVHKLANVLRTAMRGR
jgi:signal transduction histidine kinase/CheY-like chemotaxis protein